MSALTPPRTDLRAGSTSDDSLAMSKRIFIPLTVLCTFAADLQNPRSQGVIERAHLSLKLLGRGSAWVSYRLLGAISRERMEVSSTRWGRRNHEAFVFCATHVTAPERAPTNQLSWPWACLSQAGFTKRTHLRDKYFMYMVVSLMEKGMLLSWRVGRIVRSL